ncbi:MAG TPA: CHAT domain-containing tetratricopeptide repeat protein [Chryseolinea sp.]|nr:CHAT domain-containing tetratricopeptide repeat protein [Chryseolinea sp.]
MDSLLLDSQFDEAILEAERGLKSTSDQKQKVILENKRAEALMRAGRLDEAERQLDSIVLKALPPDLLAITQTNQGFLFLSQGRNDLALSKFQEAILVMEKENMQNSLEGARLLSYLGSLYLATGKYAQAEEQLGMALSIREKLVSENSELIAASYNDLGLVYNVRDANKALDYYEKALEIYERIHGKNHSKTAIANTNIGFTYRTLELYGDAVTNFESAIATWEKIYPQPHPTKAFILFNLGQTYSKIGDEKSTENYYALALKMYRESYGKKHPAIATVLNAIGSLKVSQGKFTEGLNVFQQALISNVGNFENATISVNPTLKNYYSGNTLLYSLLNKAEALEARYFGKTLKFKELALAAKTLNVCDSLIDNLRQQITNENDKITLGNTATDVYAAGARIAYEAGQVAAEKKSWYELAFYFAEKSKSAVLLEAISESDAKSYSGIPYDQLEEEKKLKAEIALTAQRLSSKPTDSEERYLREMLFGLNRSYENFIKELESKYPAYYNLKFNVATPSISSLQSKLERRTAIISYFGDEKNNRLYIFIITAKKFSVRSYPLPQTFDRSLNGLRNSLVFNDLETYRTAAEKLSELLIPKNIPRYVTDIIILPTGRLSIIPFETLFLSKLKKEMTFAEFPYLLRKYDVRYEFSAALILQKSKNEARKESSILLCAPVTFEKDRLVELPATESEVNEISQLFSSRNHKSTVLIRQEADEKKVKDGSLKDFSYLHFATHGIVDEINPDLSRIYLRTSSVSEDGNLYSGEIYNLDLDANLVTLSACQTGLGKISKGEGVIGLSRALVYAGSKNVIVSFWSVADQSTASLMKLFYRQVLNTSANNFSNALRQAKIQLILEGKYSSPYYWAPFILIGF